MLRIAAGAGHIGNLKSTLKSTLLLAVLPALRHGGTNPRGECCPVPDSDWRCARAPGPRRPHSDGPRSPNAHTHKQPPAPRRTLSFTIASQTIASSPDGSEISSAASCAFGTPAAAVGGGCLFRASSTVTSNSSPCNNAFGHSAAHARSSGRRRREGVLCRQQRIPCCVVSRGGIPVE
jgi:hypothetical protein